ncbi:MAG: type II toxin-antitoxin system HicB family antitoxin [Planctomycetaceae bacterium]|nr:type II toxin-antitoxin system HicB family antitoxin [Planctomycetaceae bacterium]
MLVYKAAYVTSNDGWVVGQVLDFPGVVSQGRDLEDARRMLGAALVDVAESLLLDGQPLPQADASLTDESADLEEPIYLVLDAGVHVKTVVDRVLS